MLDFRSIVADAESFFIIEHSSKINALTFEPESKNIISCTSNKTLSVIDVQTSTQIYSTTLEEEPISLAWIGSYLLIGESIGNLQLWDPQTATFISKFNCHQGRFLITIIQLIISIKKRTLHEN